MEFVVSWSYLIFIAINSYLGQILIAKHFLTTFCNKYKRPVYNFESSAPHGVKNTSCKNVLLWYTGFKNYLKTEKFRKILFISKTANFLQNRIQSIYIDLWCNWKLKHLQNIFEKVFLSFQWVSPIYKTAATG